MKCLQCGGNIISTMNLVYRTDGGSSGKYQCQKCGRVRIWSVDGHEELTIDMEDSLNHGSGKHE
jgi:hypothetical protein